MENVILKDKFNLNIKKIDIAKFVIYFTFYSFIGFCIESSYGIITKGVIESRQSFLFGPFCAIYGIGAIFMITLLKPFNKNLIAIFIGSSIIGALTEYLMSLLCEIYLHFKWWDYSDYFLNINGRTCLFFVVIWGFLGVLLVRIINPKLDNFIYKIRKKINKKVFNFAIFGLTLFLIIDIFLTTFALKYFYAKISIDYDLPNSNYSIKKLNNIKKIKIFNENNLLKIYPNMRIAGNKFDNVFIDSLYNVSPTYYLKIFDKTNNDSIFP